MGKWEDIMRIEKFDSTIYVLNNMDYEKGIALEEDVNGNMSVLYQDIGNDYSKTHPMELYLYEEADYYVPKKYEKSHKEFFNSLIDYIEEFELDELECSYDITKEQFEIIKTNFENTVYIEFI